MTGRLSIYTYATISTAVTVEVLLKEVEVGCDGKRRVTKSGVDDGPKEKRVKTIGIEQVEFSNEKYRSREGKGLDHADKAVNKKGSALQQDKPGIWQPAIHGKTECSEASAHGNEAAAVFPPMPTDETVVQMLFENADVIKTREYYNDLNVYRIPLKTNDIKPRKNYQLRYFGNKERGTNEHRVIMLVGETGAGKSTLINGMINFILQVDWKDQFRFKIISEETENHDLTQAKSQTQNIVCYTIYPGTGMQLEYTLTIIDTPGFGDTRGLDHDRRITDYIREFFTSSSEHHIDHIDAIGFVAQSSQSRLTIPQRYVFDSVLSIFGKDIKDNIMIAATFADGQKPALTAALKEAEIQCDRNMFKFNNSALFANNGMSTRKASSNNNNDQNEDNSAFEALVWEMGRQSMKKFFHSLEKMQPKDMSLTKEVLTERHQLEASLEGLLMQIQVAHTKMDELRREEEALEKHKAEAEKNKDFTYTVEVVNHETSQLYKRIATNCAKCQFTCHIPCMSYDWNIRLCDAFTLGQCTVCPGRCSVNDHSVQDFQHVYQKQKEERKYLDLEMKYKQATGNQMTYQEIIRAHKNQLTDVSKRVEQLIHELRNRLNRLQKIALKPNPIDMIDYIDMLIHSEKSKAKEGYQSRIESLEQVKQKARLLEGVRQEKFAPLETGGSNQGQGSQDEENKGWGATFLSWCKRKYNNK